MSNKCSRGPGRRLGRRMCRAAVVAVGLSGCAAQPVYDNSGYPVSRSAYQTVAWLRQPDAERLRAMLVRDDQTIDVARADWVFARLITGVLPAALQVSFLTQVAEFDLDRARDYADRLLQRYPEAVPLLNQRGWLAARQGEYDVAEGYWRLALVHDAGSRRALAGMADVALWQGQNEIAIQRLRTYLSLFPDDVRRTRRLQALTGQIVAAVTDAIKTLGVPAVFQELGELYTLAGDYDAAVAAYELFLAARAMGDGQRHGVMSAMAAVRGVQDDRFRKPGE